MKTLLEFLPAIAEKSQYRFAENFLNVLSKSAKYEVSGTAYFVHYEYDGRPCYIITDNLSEVIVMAKTYGKDCQILQLTEDGNVCEI